MYESNDKLVSRPLHYQSVTGMEVIDVIEAFTFDLKGIEATDTGTSSNIFAVGSRKTAFKIWKKSCGTHNILLNI